MYDSSTLGWRETYPWTPLRRLNLRLVSSKRAFLWFLTLLVFLPSASAQVWDPTGNGLLNGGYRFRQVAYQTNAFGNVLQAITLSGTITFDGAGNYSLVGTLFTSQLGVPQPYSQNGTYSISASGYGFLTQPLGTPDPVYGLVSDGIFVGSTVDGFNDLMIAVPAGTATLDSFSGAYSIAYMNFTGSFLSTYDVLAQLNPNGAGGIGTVDLAVYVGLNSAPIMLSESGVTYSFSQGVGLMSFPQSPAISGSQYVFLSPDGNFIFGGSPAGFDFYVGVRKAAAETLPTLGGLYYQAGIDQDNSNVQFGILTTFYGSFKAVGGVILGHQRFLSNTNTGGQNFGFQTAFPAEPAGQYVNDEGNRDYIVSPGGAFRIGLGRAPFLGIEVAVRAPELSGPGTYLNPTGVVNAASYSAFTSGVARGELLLLYGTNLADALVVSPGVPFQLMLGGVQVFMNNRPCALYYVSPDKIAAIVPYGTTEPIVQIQVVKNGQTSNAVTAFVYKSAPGVFSLSVNGIGPGAVLHADYSLVTAARPAHPGEIVLVFLTGLGDVFPTIPDGAPGGVTQLNQTVNPMRATIEGLEAEISYAGLAPTLSGLYQMNIKIPAMAGTGNLQLGIGGPDAFSSQVTIAVAPE